MDIYLDGLYMYSKIKRAHVRRRAKTQLRKQICGTNNICKTEWYMKKGSRKDQSDKESFRVQRKTTLSQWIQSRERGRKQFSPVIQTTAQ